MICRGTADSHCCWVGAAGVCPFVELRPGPSCSLRRELGDWSKVHVDVRYVTTVQPHLRAANIAVDCGDWPPPGVKCEACGGCD